METKIESKLAYCPKCGSNDLEYSEEYRINGANEPKDESIHYPYTCQECGFNGEEVYAVIFCGHTNSENREEWYPL